MDRTVAPLLTLLLSLPVAAAGYTGFGIPFTGEQGTTLYMYIPTFENFLLQGIELTVDLSYLPNEPDTAGTGGLRLTLSHNETTIPLLDLRHDPADDSETTHLNGTYTFTEAAGDNPRPILLTAEEPILPSGPYLPEESLEEGGFGGQRATGMWTLRVEGMAGWQGSIDTWKLHLIPAAAPPVPEPTSLLLVATCTLITLIAHRCPGRRWSWGH